MNSVLYPAIALMNRLSFGMKFSLISVLFFLPMLVTNYYLVKESYDAFVDTRTELGSLDVLSASLKLRQQLEQLNDLYQINAVLGQSGQSEKIAARKRILYLKLQRLRSISGIHGRAGMVSGQWPFPLQSRISLPCRSIDQPAPGWRKTIMAIGDV